MKLKIKNYQAIKNAELEFQPGINSIIGGTNNGKSSIIRAIRGAINNQGGNSFINYEADSCSVEIDFNEHNIMWSKSRKQGKSSYVIDGVTLKKIGQTQLEEVAAIMNMPEVQVNNERHQINFWRQMDKPFLVDKTPSQLFDFVVKSDEQEIIKVLAEETQEKIKEINKDLVVTTANIDSNTTAISTLSDEIQKLSKFNDIEVSRLELMLNIEENLEVLIDRATSANVVYLQLQQELKDITNTLKKVSDTNINVLSQDIQKLSVVENYILALSNSISKVTEAKTILSNLIELNAILEIKLKQANHLFNLVKTHEANYRDTKTPFDTLVLLTSSHNKLISSYNVINETLLETQKELDSFEVCPLCGNTLQDHMEVHDEHS